MGGECVCCVSESTSSSHMVAGTFQSIELPMTIPRSAFDRECDYYGISADASVVAQESIAKTMDTLTAPLTEAIRNHSMFLFALECCYQFCQRRPAGPVEVYITPKHGLYDRLKESLEKARSDQCDERKAFDMYLDRHFGLKVSGNYGVLSGHEVPSPTYRVAVDKK